MSERAGLSVQPVDSEARANPKVPGPIFIDRVDPVVVEARRILRIMPKVSECTRSRVVSVESAIVSAEPQDACAVRIDRSDILVAEAAFVGRISPPSAESQTGGRESIHAAFLRSHPEAAVSIGSQREDFVSAQAVAVRCIVAKDRKCAGRGIE